MNDKLILKALRRLLCNCHTNEGDIIEEIDEALNPTKTDKAYAESFENNSQIPEVNVVKGKDGGSSTSRDDGGISPLNSSAITETQKSHPADTTQSGRSGE